MNTRPSAHPSPRQLAAYALKKLSGSNEEKIRRHLIKCAKCSGLLARSTNDDLQRLLNERPSSDSTSVRRISETKPALPSANVQPSDKAKTTDRTFAPEHFTPPSDVKSLPTELQNQSKYEIRRLLGQGGMGAV